MKKSMYPTLYIVQHMNYLFSWSKQEFLLHLTFFLRQITEKLTFGPNKDFISAFLKVKISHPLVKAAFLSAPERKQDNPVYITFQTIPIRGRKVGGGHTLGAFISEFNFKRDSNFLPFFSILPSTNSRQEARVRDGNEPFWSPSSFSS